MKKILFIFTLVISFLVTPTFAGGGLAHMFIAQEAIEKIPDARLRNLLKDNIDAYLVGSYYPDSGYVDGAHYGEDSHWDPFINAFADYLKQKYNDPISQNPKLVAFMFGCAAHRVSDEIIHWTFYKAVSQHDFNGDGTTAHKYGDTGIDILLNVDKNQWISEPFDWWVPVSDLLQVYKGMGKTNYTEKEIIWGNSVISASGAGERAISPATYYYLKKWKMPWTAKNYYDYSEGGMLMDEAQVAYYQSRLWQQLQDKTSKTHMSLKATVKQTQSGTKPDATLTGIVNQALTNGTLGVDVTANIDGSVNLGKPVVKQASTFNNMVNTIVQRF